MGEGPGDTFRGLKRGGVGGIRSPSAAGDPAHSPAPESLLDLLSLPILTSFLSLEAPEAIPAPTILLFLRTLPRANKDARIHWSEPVTSRLAWRPRQLTNPAEEPQAEENQVTSLRVFILASRQGPWVC